MPYKCIPRIMIREIVKQRNDVLNAFGTKYSVSDGLSPQNIIDNIPHVNCNDLKCEFRQYVQLNVTQKVTNTMKSRTIGAIVLSPRRIQGHYNYMSLETWEKIHGKNLPCFPLLATLFNGLKLSENAVTTFHSVPDATVQVETRT